MKESRTGYGILGRNYTHMIFKNVANYLHEKHVSVSYKNISITKIHDVEIKEIFTFKQCLGPITGCFKQSFKRTTFGRSLISAANVTENKASYISFIARNRLGQRCRFDDREDRDFYMDGGSKTKCEYAKKERKGKLRNACVQIRAALTERCVC